MGPPVVAAGHGDRLTQVAQPAPLGQLFSLVEDTPSDFSLAVALFLHPQPGPRAVAAGDVALSPRAGAEAWLCVARDEERTENSTFS